MQLVDDVAAYAVIVFRHDAHSLAVVQRGGEVIDHQSVDPGADKSDDHHAEGVDEECRAADDGTGDAHRGPNVEVQILVHNLGQNVETAGGGVDAEHQSLCGTQQQHEAAEVQPRVAHYRRGAGHQVVVGNLLPREDGVPHVGERTENHGGINRLGSELMSNQQPRQDEEDGVDGHDDDGQTNVDARGLEDVVQHNRETRDGADNQLAGHQKIIYSGSGYKHAESHDN